jgi:hypothetical protein
MQKVPNHDTILRTAKAFVTHVVSGITINSWSDGNLEQEAGKYFFDKDICEVQAQHTDSVKPQMVFINGGKMAIGSNADSRMVLGISICLCL